MGNPILEATLTLCQSRPSPPVRDFGFCLRSWNGRLLIDLSPPTRTVTFCPTMLRIRAFPDPDFFFFTSQASHPTTTTKYKREREKICCQTFFVAFNFAKNNFIYEQEYKFFELTDKLKNFLPKIIANKLPENVLVITDTRYRSQREKHRIPDPQHWYYRLRILLNRFILSVKITFCLPSNR